MKKLLLSGSIISLLFLFGSISQAQVMSGCPTGQTICNPLRFDNFEDLVKSLIDFAFIIALAVAPLMVIIAGFLWITSAGDPTRLKTPKAIVLYTAIGLGVILLARGLIAIIQSVLGG
jgi:hypothetical protein